MRYLVRARVKPGREADLLQAIEDETLGKGSVAEGDYLFNTLGRFRGALTMANTYKLTLGSLLDAARTTVAAVASLLLARTLKLPEFYWAPISAIVIIQSTIDPRTLAWQRFAGTALGAA